MTTAASNDYKEVHLENESYVKELVNYLTVLQNGRVKPNSNKSSNEATVRDSIDNLVDINAVKDRLNDIFGITLSEGARERRGI